MIPGHPLVTSFFFLFLPPPTATATIIIMFATRQCAVCVNRNKWRRNNSRKWRRKKEHPKTGLTHKKSRKPKWPYILSSHPSNSDYAPPPLASPTKYQPKTYCMLFSACNSCTPSDNAFSISALHCESDWYEIFVYMFPLTYAEDVWTRQTACCPSYLPVFFASINID